MITEIYDTLDVCNWDWIPGATLPIGRRLPVQQDARDNVVLSYSRLSCARDACRRIARYPPGTFAQGALALPFDSVKELVQT